MNIDPKLSLTLEAALCAWEWMLENHEGPQLKELWEGLGSSAMRHCAMQAGDVALKTYQLMESKRLEFHSCYDWEFVPGVMTRIDWEKLTEHNQYNGPAYEPDLEAILIDMVKDNQDFHDAWVSEAKTEAKKQWAYADLVSDHEDKIDRTETPAEWVKRIGEKYDLTPVGEW